MSYVDRDTMYRKLHCDFNNGPHMIAAVTIVLLLQVIVTTFRKLSDIPEDRFPMTQRAEGV